MECGLGRTGQAEGCWSWVRVHTGAHVSALVTVKEMQVQWIWSLLGKLGRQAEAMVKLSVSGKQLGSYSKDSEETWRGQKQEDTIRFVFHKNPFHCQVQVG